MTILSLGKWDASHSEWDLVTRNGKTCQNSKMEMRIENFEVEYRKQMSWKIAPLLRTVLEVELRWIGFPFRGESKALGITANKIYFSDMPGYELNPSITNEMF